MKKGRMICDSIITTQKSGITLVMSGAMKALSEKVMVAKSRNLIGTGMVFLEHGMVM
jgi:hypothetical protein